MFDFSTFSWRRVGAYAALFAVAVALAAIGEPAFAAIGALILIVILLAALGLLAFVAFALAVLAKAFPVTKAQA